jgi:hypothetical protein
MIANVKAADPDARLTQPAEINIKFRPVVMSSVEALAS